jgi:hypothetical protein
MRLAVCFSPDIIVADPPIHENLNQLAEFLKYKER